MHQGLSTLWARDNFGCGLYASHEDYFQALERSGVSMTSWARNAIRRCRLLSRASIDVIVAPAGEMTVEQPRSFRNVCIGAMEQGLFLLPTSFALDVRLQYRESAADDFLLLAGHPPNVWGSTFATFGLCNISRAPALVDVDVSESAPLDSNQRMLFGLSQH